MNNEPVAWMHKNPDYAISKHQSLEYNIPLYIYSDQIGLAESIIKQQKLEIDALHNLVKEQDKKIIDLAFDKVYAERSAEVVAELYTHPAKYCPSEDNAAYEKGFVDGMAQMTESAVHRAVEGMSAKTLTDKEIEEVAQALIDDRSYCSLHFARAILKKASEK
jgi:hypothetical protein